VSLKLKGGWEKKNLILREKEILLWERIFQKFPLKILLLGQICPWGILNGSYVVV
jgi:hypothetical protein